MCPFDLGIDIRTEFLLNLVSTLNLRKYYIDY